MRGQGDEAAARLRVAGWRQGSIVGNETLAAIGLTDCDVAVVISQDCDILQSVDIEPHVELILGNFLDEPRADCRYGRNPRLLDVVAIDRTRAFTVDIRKRVFASKKHLTNHRPASVAMTRDDVAGLAKWVGKRYTRVAWPDAFNERLRVVDKRLERLFKSKLGMPISSILLHLNPPDAELAGEEHYSLNIWLTVFEATRMNESEISMAQGFGQRLREIINDCEGVLLREILVRSESVVTMEHLRSYRPFDRDYRSAAPIPGGQLPPYDV